MGRLGLGVMLHMLTSNASTVNAVSHCLNKRIESIYLRDDALVMEFDDCFLHIRDDGQSCCESRYMTTDDTLSDYVGQILIDLELKSVQTEGDEWGGEHEIQFLDVITDKDRFQVANHNEHNGYYGGFAITASMTPKTTINND